MEVKGQLISAPDRKQRERMAELQERRRSLQALLSTRLAELRRICLQEAELTGAVPSDFPLEAGEKPPCVRRRGGTSRTGNRKCRAEMMACLSGAPRWALLILQWRFSTITKPRGTHCTTGLRDWYLRNTIGSSHTNQANGKVNAGVKGQTGGGAALQRRRTTHGVIQPPTYQTETSHHTASHHKQTALPHSATFHGHPLHASSLYHDSFPPQKQEVPSVDQPSPGTLV
eukprot:superscaffoldBa00003717_g17550